MGVILNARLTGENEFMLGRSRTRLILGNIIFVEANGEFSSENAEKQREINQNLAAKVDGKINYLIDLNNAGKSSPEARKIWQNLSEDKNTFRVALFGLHPVAKVIASFSMGVIRKKEMKFFWTRDEALQWLRS